MRRAASPDHNNATSSRITGSDMTPSAVRNHLAVLFQQVSVSLMPRDGTASNDQDQTEPLQSAGDRVRGRNGSLGLGVGDDAHDFAALEREFDVLGGAHGNVAGCEAGPGVVPITSLAVSAASVQVARRKATARL